MLGLITKPQTSAADVLERAATLIEQGAWTQGAEARDESGGEVSATSETAVCFCAAGAIMRAQNAGGWQAAWHMFESLVGEDAIDWNDAPERTCTEVVAKLRDAAALPDASQGSN